MMPVRITALSLSGPYYYYYYYYYYYFIIERAYDVASHLTWS